MAMQRASFLPNKEILARAHKKTIEDIKDTYEIRLEPVGRAFLTPNTLRDKEPESYLGQNRIKGPGIYIAYANPFSNSWKLQDKDGSKIWLPTIPKYKLEKHEKDLRVEHKNKIEEICNHA